MHPAAAEAARFAGRIQPRHWLAVSAECLRLQVRFDAAEALAGENVEFDCDEWSGRRVEDAVRPRDPDELVAQVAAGLAQGRNLEVLGELVRQLAVACLDLVAHGSGVQLDVGGELPHARDQFVKGVRDDKVFALLFERLDRPGRALADPLQ